jgi:hypothetical protein
VGEKNILFNSTASISNASCKTQISKFNANMTVATVASIKLANAPGEWWPAKLELTGAFQCARRL